MIKTDNIKIYLKRLLKDLNRKIMYQALDIFPEQSLLFINVSCIVLHISIFVNVCIYTSSINNYTRIVICVYMSKYIQI